MTQNLPVVVLVGSPNVGKSTLFNRLTESRDAIVSAVRGLTRDRHYGKFLLEQFPVLLVDTGGLTDGEDGLAYAINQQVREGLVEADLILWVVDGKLGLTANDEQIVPELRKLNKSICVVVNKLDFREETEVIEDFLRLGLPLVAISAEHNRGIGGLKEVIQAHLAEQHLLQLVPEVELDHVKIALIGRPNVGKSTLVNRILGQKRMIVSEAAGTTRDTIAVDFERKKQRYRLFDTAGIRRKSRITKASVENFSVIKSLQTVELVDIVVLVVDATETISDQDLKMVGYVLEKGSLLILVGNKLDLLTSTQKNVFHAEIERRLGFASFIPYLTLSAYTGQGVGKLFKLIEECYKRSCRTFGTGELNRLLAKALLHHAPPMVKGREIKLRYLHFGHHRPTTFIVHGARVKELNEGYVRYLEKYFREALNLPGVVKFIFKEG